AIYMSALRPGGAIEARSEALDNALLTGTIESVDTRVDPITRAILVRAILPNEDGIIKPGLLMRVTLLKDTRTSLIVPEESVLQRQNDHFVLVVNPDTLIVEQR